jgi:Fe-S-cluster containining protein
LASIFCFLPNATEYITDLDLLAAQAELKSEENAHFLLSLRHHDTAELDNIAHVVNAEVSSAIDCTACGNCCQKLVINVTHEEVDMLAAHLRLTPSTTKEKYIEESQGGNCFINTIPCHFLSDKKCTIYESRFTECRDFPHLHKPGFKARLAGTLNYYGSCPIIYNVIEEMKTRLRFLNDD